MSQVLKPRKGYKFVDAGFEKFDEIPEDWKYEEFQDIIKKDNTKKIKIKTLDYENKGKIPIIDQGQDLICGYTDDVTLTYSGKLPVIVFGDHTLAVKFIDFPFAIGADGTKIIQINQDNGLVKFFYYAIQNRNLASEGYKRHFSKLREQKFCYPTIVTEQEKIASILSNVDNLITSTQKIIEKTERLKKGLMQKLLTRGIGHDKFKKVLWLFGKEIEIPDDWKIKPVKELGKIITGSTPSTSNKEFFNGVYLWVSPSDFEREKYVKQTNFKLTEKGLKITRKIPKNAILVVCIGSTIGKIGMAYEEMTTNQQINSIICNYDDPNFVYYQLLQNNYLIKNMANQVAVPILNKTEFGKIKIFIPKKQNEQRKIASILSGIDASNYAQTQYKEKLERLKKSLMQKLLTGQIRVKV